MVTAYKLTVTGIEWNHVQNKYPITNAVAKTPGDNHVAVKSLPP